MLLDELVTTSDTVAATRSRLAKVDALAALLVRLEPDEIAPAIGFLVGKPRQGRVGVGWRSVATVMGEPAETPSLTVGDLDALLDRLRATAGTGMGRGYGMSHTPRVDVRDGTCYHAAPDGPVVGIQLGDTVRYAPGREEDKQHRFALIGFGGGVHKCAGMNFANMEMTIITALLLQQFDLQLLTPNPTVEHGLGASRPTPTHSGCRR